MAGKIKILDDAVISQIAAGEVIERPASVVKELVENSIDADASQIFIEVSDGGKKSIKVVDNGIGMSREDAETALLRYSTSKITTLRDLESINSLGFRGEALASIAAVAKLTLLTKPRNAGAKAGTEVFAKGDKIKHVKDASCNEGTTVIVGELFYNTPARRKHLKNTRAEIAKITDIVTRQALIHPQIFFKLVHNGSEIINTPRTSSSLDNIVHIYGKETAREMLALDYHEHDLKIEGHISKPAVTRKSSSHVSIFVNKRFITSKLLNTAIKEGYRNLIMKNSYPIAVISLDIHPRKIDVNVHPTKQEIRFEEEKHVYNAFRGAVENALQSKSLIPEFGKVKEEMKEQKVLDIHQIKGPDLLKEIAPIIEAGRQINIEGFPGKTEIEPLEEPELDGEKTQLPKIALIGQILYTYIVAQSKDELLLIDQHAAHERVLFDRLMGSESKGRREQQELLSPLTMELTPKQKNFLTQNLELLESMGFEIEPFGGNTFHVRAVPVVLREILDSKTLHDIIDELVDVGKTKHEEELKEKAMAIVACHSAIRAGKELSRIEMKSLMESLYTTENPFSCPHGRPSIMSISKGEIEKRFKRKL